VAYTLGWTYAELMDLDVDELMEWHRQAARINKAVAGKEG
jgi:hypothetical protein